MPCQGDRIRPGIEFSGVIKVRRQDIKFISVRLRALRRQSDLTQEAFAEYVGMGYKNYQNIEAGRHWNLRHETVLWLASAHGLSLSRFYAAKVPQTKLMWRRSMGLPRRRRQAVY